MAKRIKKYIVYTFLYFIVYAALFAKKDGDVVNSLAMAIAAGLGNALGRENVINHRSMAGEVLFLGIMFGITFGLQVHFSTEYESLAIIEKIYMPFAIFTMLARFFETRSQAMESEDSDKEDVNDQNDQDDKN